MVTDISKYTDLPFPKSLLEFQNMFPDDSACAAYLEVLRWKNGFICSKCGAAGEPFRFATRPGVLRCKGCRGDSALRTFTIMEDSHLPLYIWFFGAFLVANDTEKMSIVKFQGLLGLTRYETAYVILHKLRARKFVINNDSNMFRLLLNSGA